MTNDHTSLSPQSESLQLGPAAPQLIVPGLVLAAIGGVLAWFCGFRQEYAPGLFSHAYLLAFVFYLTIALGALFFVILHHLAKAGWSVTLRRLAEALSGNILLLAILFVPIAFSLGDIYPWAKKSHSDQQAAKGEAAEETPAAKSEAAQGESAKGESEKVIPGHERWLTPTNFIGRFVIYFAIWGFLAWYFRGHSILQDRTGRVELSSSMQRISAPGMILFSITLTGAAIDLIMSLNPHWYSTMIGVYVFAESVLSGLVAISLLALWLQSAGLLRGVVTKEHYQDLGKLTFGFVIFWAYIAYSQYMLIWYANMPEETQFYIPRQIGPWAGVSLALVVVHFVLPFLGLMSKHVKRALPLFAFWLIWLLVAHAFDLFWLIMPNIFIQQFPVDTTLPGGPLPETFKKILESPQSIYQLSENSASLANFVNAPLQPLAIATVIGLLLFMGGLFLALTAWLLSGAALIPLKDPRLDESLNFHNT
jgi:hypothetical protein